MQKSSVADPGCLSEIMNPRSWFFFHPGSRIQQQQKFYKFVNNKNYLNVKCWTGAEKKQKWLRSSQKYGLDQRSGKLIPDSNPGLRRAPDSGSATLKFALHWNFFHIRYRKCLPIFFQMNIFSGPWGIRILSPVCILF